MRKRPLRSVLALPQTAAELRAADRHIARESARIRSTWSDQMFRQRAGLPFEPWTPPEVHGDDPDPE